MAKEKTKLKTEKMEREVYDTIQEYLLNNEIYLSNDEIDAVIRVSNKAKIESEHIGIRPERCQHNDREAAFQKHWLKENLIQPGINSGLGTLQGLFIENTDINRPMTSGKAVEEISKRDRMIVATVIQWLGSNCGFCFLQETLSDCGYKITRTP
jgi:hypothetical protein